ncbi:hypothetical protein [Larkinella rosea]|uniref:Uncharacterized protein n=1 Tax=Larkinella rosea TaxID=2025312 RepID=A0A3P1C3B4_9BACT|nr:hypothetical protein [Larkinella rosea]RRB07553.1 hypothetical protein EHT25_07165 [Larkinella rosea]
MKNRLLILLSAALWLACQSKDSSEFGIEPGGNTYNDDATPTKKMMCSGTNCDNPNSVEQYTYNKNGKLIRIDYLGRVASGQMEVLSYVEQIYNKHDNLVGKIRYGKYGSEGWTAYEESEFEYAEGGLLTERIYFNQRNPEKRVLTGLVQYEFKDGKKIGQKWFDAREQPSYRVAYEYKNDVLIRETWYSDTDKIIRLFTHSFAGNRRQISEHMPNRSEQIALIEKTYDKKGRLITEETKVNNPLLCSMVAGVIQYAY